MVTWSGRKNGYGNVVEVGHADGYTTLYAHNQKNLVEVGDLVKRGQVLAKVSTGRSTGYHVHFEVMKDGRVMESASSHARLFPSERRALICYFSHTRFRVECSLSCR